MGPDLKNRKRSSDQQNKNHEKPYETAPIDN